MTQLLKVPYLGYQKIALKHVPLETVRFTRLAAAKVGAKVSARLAPAQGYMEHYGVHSPRNNAGDTVLFQVIEDLFDSHFGKLPWRQTQLRQLVTSEDVARINDRARAVLVGGGGLLIEDSNPNAESGWQWRINPQNLEAITAPLLLFAVGYNFFRGGAEPGPTFVSHVQKTLEKSAFFGMRNHGSIARTKALMPEHLHEKISFQPCMTTVLSEYHPLFKNGGVRAPKERRLVLNLAFDRAEQRFGADAPKILDRIGDAVDVALADGWKVDLVLHGWDDEPAGDYFRARGTDINFVYLNLCTAEEIVSYYRDATFTVGMRGHSQMIPFGCGNPIFSLISHDKMRFFLEDIGQNDWGAEIFDEDLTDQIVAACRKAVSDGDALRARIAEIKVGLWAVTCANLEKIEIEI